MAQELNDEQAPAQPDGPTLEAWAWIARARAAAARARSEQEAPAQGGSVPDAGEAPAGD